MQVVSVINVQKDWIIKAMRFLKPMLLHEIDKGQDLQVGDIVYIRAIVVTAPDSLGDCKIQIDARNGYDNSCAIRINATFLKRVKWLLPLLRVIIRTKIQRYLQVDR